MDVIDTTLAEELRAHFDSIVSEASAALGRAHLPHYDEAGAATARDRLAALLELVVRCVTERSVTPICAFAEQVATERFRSGYGVGEVQTAFNVVEEAIWRVVISRTAPDDLVRVAGSVGTVLGAGKDALARTWVSLAAREHVASLDMSALFLGAGS